MPGAKYSMWAVVAYPLIIFSLVLFKLWLAGVQRGPWFYDVVRRGGQMLLKVDNNASDSITTVELLRTKCRIVKIAFHFCRLGNSARCLRSTHDLTRRLKVHRVACSTHRMFGGRVVRCFIRRCVTKHAPIPYALYGGCLG